MIELGGRERELRYDWNAIRRLEEKTGLGYVKVFESLTERIGLIVDLVWAGLLHEEPALDIVTVENWMNDCHDIEAVAEEIGERGAAAFEKKKVS